MKQCRTDIGWSSPASITLFGRSLPDEILGHLRFGDMAILELTARTPTKQESRGFNGSYVGLIQKVAVEAGRSRKRDFPTNATGVLGALCREMGLDWRICRGLGVMARAVGLVGHILEESRNPIAADLWLRTEKATRHLRPSPAEG